MAFAGTIDAKKTMTVFFNLDEYACKDYHWGLIRPTLLCFPGESMHLVPKADDPLYVQNRCQCQDCGYIFLRKTGFLSRCFSLLFGEVCPNCTGKKIISLAQTNPINVASPAFSPAQQLHRSKVEEF